MERLQDSIWPWILLFAVAALVAAGVAVYAGTHVNEQSASPGGGLTALPIAYTDSSHPGLARIVTREGGCRVPLRAQVSDQGGQAVVSVLGEDTAEACTAQIKLRCSEVSVPRGEPVRPLPLSSPQLTPSAAQAA